jgi:hypothetical protein
VSSILAVDSDTLAPARPTGAIVSLVDLILVETRNFDGLALIGGRGPSLYSLVDDKRECSYYVVLR